MFQEKSGKFMKSANCHVWWKRVWHVSSGDGICLWEKHIGAVKTKDGNSAEYDRRVELGWRTSTVCLLVHTV